MMKAYIDRVRKINPWIRFLMIVLVMAVTGLVAWNIARNYVAPFSARAGITLDASALPADADLVKLSGEAAAAVQKDAGLRDKMLAHMNVSSSEQILADAAAVLAGIPEEMLQECGVISQGEHFDPQSLKMTTLDSTLDKALNSQAIAMISGVPEEMQRIRGELQQYVAVEKLIFATRVTVMEDGQLTVTAQAQTVETAVLLADSYAACLAPMLPGGEANAVAPAAKVPTAGGHVTMITLVSVVIAGLLAYVLISGQPLFDSFNTVFFGLFTLLCVFPFYYLFINTISANDAVVSGRVNFLPMGLHAKNYLSMFGLQEVPVELYIVLGIILLAVGLAVLGFWGVKRLAKKLETKMPPDAARRTARICVIVLVAVVYLLMFIFSKPSFQALAAAFGQNTATDIPQAFLVTAARTVFGTALMVIVSAWAGYLVTKQKMYKRSLMYRLLVITMYFNAGLIPWYMNMLMLGLTESFWAYIIPGVIAPYNIILVKTYIESIPASLEESAVIDGANTPQVFLQIILPLSVPILATIAIFGAVGNWNSFQDSLLLMNKQTHLYTLQHRLYVYLNSSSNLGAMMSGSGGLSTQAAQNMLNMRVIKYTVSMVSIIPILLVYPFMQRYFVKGIMLGAVKG